MKIKRILFLFLITAFCLFAFGCEDKVEPVTEYNLTFDLDGGTTDTDLVTKYTSGKDYKLVSPTKEGYSFAGWFEVLEDGSLSERKVTELFDRDYNLKAIWEEIITPDELTDLYTPVKRIHKNVVFKVYSNKELKMDIYLPAMERDKTYPVLFFFFGGGWVFGDKSLLSSYNIILSDIVNQGFIIVAPNYRLVSVDGGTHFPSQVEDCFDAIRYVVKYQEELHADVNNMGSFGHSAGGYFSLMSAFAQDHFKGEENLSSYEFNIKYAIALSAPCVYSKEALKNISTYGKSLLVSFLGTNNLYDETLISAFPSYYIGENNPQIYLVHGTSDELVPIEQSREFYSIAQEAGIDVSIIEIPYASHTYGGTGGHDISSDYRAGAKVIADFIISQKTRNEE